MSVSVRQDQRVHVLTVSVESRQMLIEVIFHDRIGNYVKDQVAEIEEGSFLLALLRGGKVDVLNPPDWDPEAFLYPEMVKESKTNIEGGSNDHGESNPQQSTDGEAPPKRPASRSGPRKKGAESPEKTQGNSSKGYGGSSEFVEDRNKSGAGEDGSSHRVGRSPDQGYSEGDKRSL